MRSTCMLHATPEIWGCSPMEASFHQANTVPSPTFLFISAKKNTSLTLSSEVQGKVLSWLSLFVPLQMNNGLFGTPQGKQWNVSKDHRMLILNKPRIITTITVIPLMAIITNINLSSAGSECHSLAQGHYDSGVPGPCCGPFLGQRRLGFGDRNLRAWYTIDHNLLLSSAFHQKPVEICQG